ncbi:putative aminotransferase [Actinoplanes missouriensis 431]|uniref:Putative aminotransferase n=1 Tax=Actinoplanes missouriensis (strain ATCC 14538 / DSM 43046 / CBS 188.64 / JCM 3121 / NBRC 102363 / NCIMB 12654 / NRRL B-3342 / UNCC 431) TaxID=512565 RepID=I0H4L1_ACTM4|nr:aspartate aminotransferase family protein [Actinoplanes missouriensis]BAL87948.1 putative aminotransferase [Actinoplanes missouriensis 431]
MTANRYERSRAELERAYRSIGGAVGSGMRRSMKPHQLFFDTAEGSRVVDVDGNEYVDYVLGWGPLLLGHRHPRVVAAVTDQLQRGDMFGAGHRLEYVAAEKLLTALGWAERLLWSNTGTEAVQSALRLARAATGRNLVIKMGGGYHGWHDTVLASIYDYSEAPKPTPHSLGQAPSSLLDLRVAAYGDLDAATALFEAERGNVAAVLVDPVSSNTGTVTPPPGYLEGLRELCDTHGALLIFDEVVTGLRTGLAGVAGRPGGVVPDLATYGKAIGSGFPVAAVAGRGEVIDLVVEGVSHSGTYNSHPLSMAAVAATIDVLSEPGVYDRLNSTASQLVAGFTAAAAETGHTIAVNALGTIVQVVAGVDQINSPYDYLVGDWEYGDLLNEELTARGVFCLPGGRFFLSTAHTAGDIAHTVDAVRSAMQAIRKPHRAG